MPNSSPSYNEASTLGHRESTRTSRELARACSGSCSPPNNGKLDPGWTKLLRGETNRAQPAKPTRERDPGGHGHDPHRHR